MTSPIVVDRFSVGSALSASMISKLTPPEFTLLTPEALLEYCKHKLEGLDAQVKTMFLKQQQRNHLSSSLSKLAESLASKSDDKSGGLKADNQALKEQIVAEFDAAILAAGGNEGVVKALQEQKAKFVASAYPQPGDSNNDAEVAAWELRGLTEAVQAVQSDVNRQGELEMIQLQSVMSQRQQALQMCTNMVQSLGQSAMGIAQNIGK